MSFRLALSGLLGVGAGTGITYFLSRDSSKIGISNNDADADNAAAAIGKITHHRMGPTTTDNPGGQSGSSLPVPYPGGVPSSSSSSLPSSKGINSTAFFKYGFPGPIHDIQQRGNFVSCYNRQTRNPYWVIEHITADALSERTADRKNSIFKEDEQIPEMFRAQLSDYFRSGYDRGHQVPAADARFSQQAMDDTFYLTNICPQVGDGFNRDYWAHFERFCRHLTDKYESVRIMTGPLYLPRRDPETGKYKVCYEVIGNPPSIAVPTHFFKLIVAEAPKKNPEADYVTVGAFVLPNEPIPNSTNLTEFEVPVNAIERSTGLTLLQSQPSGKIKSLCREVKCELVVREFNKSVSRSGTLALPDGRDKAS